MISIAFALWSLAAQASPFVQTVARQELVHYGKLAYDRRCSGCHGANGDGKGAAAAWLNPKPRDFTTGIYKFRSGPLGTMPSDDDLMRTLSTGVAGTSMPAFHEMPERERFGLVEYLKTLSSEWQDPAKRGAPVQGAPYPVADFQEHKLFMERATRGRKIFAEACVLCHGLAGRGDGEGGADLTDDWGQPIIPANLRLKTIKRGKSVQDIYTTLLVGVNGTPMPSFKDVYTDDALWDVAAYVLYLRGEEDGLYGDKIPLSPLTAAEAP
jgi:cytochrome c oxidase cbb3-type subunit I/II